MLSKNKRILYINILITLSFFVLIYLFYITFEKEKNSIFFSVVNTFNQIENIDNKAIDSIYYLHTAVDQLYKNKNNLPLEDIEKIHTINKNNSYALDDSSKINLTGYNGIPKDQNIKYEMAMALYLDNYFKTVASRNKDYVWIYYISKHKFSTLYPFTDSKDFLFDAKNHSLPIYTKGLPKNNPKRKLFFTSLYNDGVGLGLMTTIGTPIYYKNNFLGTIDIDITVASKSKVLNKSNQFNGSYLIINKNKEVVAADNILNFTTKRIFKVTELLDEKILLQAKEDKFIFSNWNYVYLKSIKNTDEKFYYVINTFELIIKPLYTIIPILLIILILFRFKQLIREQDKIDKELQKKEKLLFEQSKHAQMGEMIGNIAHQWRQPLSVISTAASGIKFQKEIGIIKDEDEIKMLDTIVNTTSFLSDTIDTFRAYIKQKKEFKEVVLQDTIIDSLNIVKASLDNNYIQLIDNIKQSEPIKITMVVGELSQVLINIINNAQDILVSNNIDDKIIKLDLVKKDNQAIITIEDNAGGIPEDILPKIFDPYFTTKHQSQGTGLGLYMSKEIIQKHLDGKLYAQNTNIGAKFFIELALNKNKIINS